MTILYALVARGTVVLAEFSAAPTNASNIARQILVKIPGTNDSHVSYSQDRYIFHVKRTDGLTILCMADDAAGNYVKIPLERSGGMIAVIDAYCLFNRARGTELISPEDLLQACAVWEKFDVYEQTDLTFSVTLQKFDSEVMVIQNKSHSDEERVFERIKTLVVKPDALRTGISASDAAITLGIAPALAKEHLLTAESRGLLCRDISPEGFRFYINLFKEIDTYDV